MRFLNWRFGIGRWIDLRRFGCEIGIREILSFYEHVIPFVMGVGFPAFEEEHEEIIVILSDLPDEISFIINGLLDAVSCASQRFVFEGFGSPLHGEDVAGAEFLIMKFCVMDGLAGDAGEFAGCADKSGSFKGGEEGGFPGC